MALTAWDRTGVCSGLVRSAAFSSLLAVSGAPTRTGGQCRPACCTVGSVFRPCESPLRRGNGPRLEGTPDNIVCHRRVVSDSLAVCICFSKRCENSLSDSPGRPTHCAKACEPCAMRSGPRTGVQNAFLASSQSAVGANFWLSQSKSPVSRQRWKRRLQCWPTSSPEVRRTLSNCERNCSGSRKAMPCRTELGKVVRDRRP